ncbi:MAG: type I restriction-modification system subunit M [Mediterranea sp.]|jgi:type I restriction enzyme M protein|nr:type I restriction-modification system subunit M [Mediterranea sp.]
MNKQQLASKIWESANRMRSKIEANEYKDYILGFIFYKYLSDTEVKFLKGKEFTDKDIQELTEEDADTRTFVQDNIGYFIAYNNLFSTWIKKGKDFDVSNVRDALSAFSRLISPTYKKVFDRIFNTLETGLSKLGDSSGAQTKAINALIQLIKDIPMNGRQDYDVLGFIYEYLISNFAANAGKKAGEFYTPHEVSLLMSEIVADHLKDRTKIQIYDPTSGSGSLLINIGASIGKHIDKKNNIKYYAQELKENTYNLTRMNLVMRGILPDNILTRNGDTLEDDWPYFDESDPIGTYNPLYVDAVVSNPPYSQAWDSTNKENDPRYAGFGIAPKTKADYAFLLHDLYHLKPDGIMTIVLPHGVLFRGGEEGEIRKQLIECNHIDTIIGLPANIFFGTGIPTIIMVLKKKRPTTDVLIVDASKGFVKVGKNNMLRASDIKRIVDTVVGRTADDEKFAKLVSQEEIRKNEYNLNIPRYVDSSETAETFDIYASMFGGIPQSELALLNKYWHTFEGLKEELFTNDGSPYCTLVVEDVEQTIKEHPSVSTFKQNYTKAFDSFAAFLKEELIDKWSTLSISKEEALISHDIFRRLEPITLVDKYNAYQVLDDEWIATANDLEILQSEGFDAAKQVDPRMVARKKGSQEEEVQDGWIGHIIPFELVQAKHPDLKQEADAIKQKVERLAEVQAAREEIAESITEEEGLSDEDKAKDRKLELEAKKLKKEIWEKEAMLHEHTKEMIEALTQEEVVQLLEAKWIEPLVTKLLALPGSIIAQLISHIRTLTEKYATTYESVASEIEETKASLSALMDELTGSEYDIKGIKELQKLLKGE